jgi:hypothetical protein
MCEVPSRPHTVRESLNWNKGFETLATSIFGLHSATSMYRSPYVQQVALRGSRDSTRHVAGLNSRRMYSDNMAQKTDKLLHFSFFSCCIHISNIKWGKREKLENRTIASSSSTFLVLYTSRIEQSVFYLLPTDVSYESLLNYYYYY